MRNPEQKAAIAKMIRRNKARARRELKSVTLHGEKCHVLRTWRTAEGYVQVAPYTDEFTGHIAYAVVERPFGESPFISSSFTRQESAEAKAASVASDCHC